MAPKKNIMNAVERMEFALEKINDFDDVDFQISNKIMDNRIITLEGYIRYLDAEGLPKIKKICEKLGVDEID